MWPLSENRTLETLKGSASVARKMENCTPRKSNQ